MRIALLGINHKSADLRYREWMAKACLKRLQGEAPLAQRLSLVLLMTCHRTEIYFTAEDLAVAHSALLQLLREEIVAPFEHTLYAYFDLDCFLHLARVTAGLDSAVVGESEIQRQVKQSYEQASLHYSLPPQIHFLFQKCLHLGKFVRSHLAPVGGQITIPNTIYEILGYFSLQQKGVLFIGNSEINRTVLSYFRHREKIASLEKRTIALCTRSPASAHELAQQYALDVFDWKDLARWRDYQVVIAGTNVSSYLLVPGEPIKTRLLFDLGVPRNVDPCLARNPHCVLHNIDTLVQAMEKKQRKQSDKLSAVENILQEKVHYYLSSFEEKRTVLCVS